MISKVVTHVHLLNLQRVIVKCMHMDWNSQWMPLPGHTCPHTRQTRPRRSCRSAPASPGRLHWPGGSRQRSWPSSGGWCRGWRGAPSGRTWACCGSWSTGHRGYKLLEWVTQHKMCHSIEPFFLNLPVLKKNEQFTLSFSVPKIDAKYSAIFYQYWICKKKRNLQIFADNFEVTILASN